MGEWTGWRPKRKNYSSHERLGREVLAAAPETYKGWSPQEIGEAALESGHPAFEGIEIVSLVDLGGLSGGRIAEDIDTKGAEEAGGVLDLLKSITGGGPSMDPQYAERGGLPGVEEGKGLLNWGQTAADATFREHLGKDSYFAEEDKLKGRPGEGLVGILSSIVRRAQSEHPVTGGKQMIPGLSQEGLDQAREAGEDFGYHTTLAGFQENAPRTGMNIASAAPQGTLAKIPKVGKTLKALSQLGDPLTGTLALAKGGIGLTKLTKRAVPKIAKGIAKPFKALDKYIVRKRETPGEPWLRSFVVSGGLGFSTNLGGKWWEQYFTKARGLLPDGLPFLEEFDRFIRRKDPHKAKGLTRRVLDDVDTVYDNLHEEYRRASEQIFAGGGFLTPEGIASGRSPAGRMIRTEGIVPQLKELAGNYNITLVEVPTGKIRKGRRTGEVGPSEEFTQTAKGMERTPAPYAAGEAGASPAIARAEEAVNQQMLEASKEATLKSYAEAGQKERQVVGEVRPPSEFTEDINAIQRRHMGESGTGAAAQEADVARTRQYIEEGINREVTESAYASGVPGQFEWDKRWSADPSSSSIADVGQNRPTVARRLDEYMNLPGEMPAVELHRLRKILDDAISTISPDSEVSANTRGAMVQMRNVIANTLENQLADTEYPSLMKRYSQQIRRIENMKYKFGAEPGQIDKYGGIEGNLEETIPQHLVGAFDESLERSTRLDDLEWLAGKSGDHRLTPAVMGAMASANFGGGLVSRSARSEVSRAMLGAVTGAAVGGQALAAWDPLLTPLVAVIEGLPALVLFSPRYSTLAVEVIENAMKRGADISTDQLARFREWSERGHLMDKALGGTLTKGMDKSYTIGKLLERSEGEEKEGNGLLRTLGGVRAQPSGDRGVRLQQ